MCALVNGHKSLDVVPRKGDVDRNITRRIVSMSGPVVPRKGDVDRNARVNGI